MLQQGSMSQLAYGPNGLVMTLSQQADQVVLATTQKWQYATYTIVLEPSTASGIVSPAILKNADPSDEVDLEVWIYVSQVPV
jgi:Glycosyl hydrolases family 16